LTDALDLIFETWGYPEERKNGRTVNVMDIANLEGVYTNWNWDKDTEFFEQKFPINKPAFVAGVKLMCSYNGLRSKKCAKVFGGEKLYKVLSSEFDTLAGDSKTVTLKQVDDGPLKKLNDATGWILPAYHFNISAKDAKRGLKALLGHDNHVLSALTESSSALVSNGLWN
jgi:hypothetical protein